MRRSHARPAMCGARLLLRAFAFFGLAFLTFASLTSAPWPLCPAARAAQPAPPVEAQPDWDETCRAILCFGSHNLMPDHSTADVVRVFTAPEADADGTLRSRLYVGYVQDPNAPGKAQAFFKGPLAEAWDAPKPAPGIEGAPEDKRPLRYWISRQAQGPDGQQQNATVEIDLEARPPVLRSLVRKPGRPPHEVREPLTAQPLTPALRLLIRSFAAPPTRTAALSLRPFTVQEEGTYASGRNLKTPNPENPDFFAVSTRDGSRCVIQALPRAPFRSLERIVAQPGAGDPRGQFLVEMMEDYLPPDAPSPMHLLHRRLHVRVGLSGIYSRVVEDGLIYDFERKVYLKAPRFRRAP